MGWEQVARRRAPAHAARAAPRRRSMCRSCARGLCGAEMTGRSIGRAHKEQPGPRRLVPTTRVAGVRMTMAGRRASGAAAPVTGCRGARRAARGRLPAEYLPGGGCDGRVGTGGAKICCFRAACACAKTTDSRKACPLAFAPCAGAGAGAATGGGVAHALHGGQQRRREERLAVSARPSGLRAAAQGRHQGLEDAPARSPW